MASPDLSKEMCKNKIESHFIYDTKKNASKKPVIGITCRFDLDKMFTNNTKAAEIEEHYIKAVNKYGGIPIGILPVQDTLFTDAIYNDIPKLTMYEKEKIIDILVICDGIILPGGGRWFEYDEFICEYAKEKNIPVLGICAGMQLMGYISRDNDKEVRTYHNRSSIKHKDLTNRYVHEILIEKDSNLYKIFNKDIIFVNSRHSFNVGQRISLDVIAKSKDDIVEAIEDKNNQFYLGVQWHPELMDEYDTDQGKIFISFINSCKHRNV